MAAKTGKQNDGGPAFPVSLAVNSVGHVYSGDPGMSLRDWFAGQALASLLAKENFYTVPKETAAWALKAADAMLAARSKTQGAE